jgi:hypothetical protein
MGIIFSKRRVTMMDKKERKKKKKCSILRGSCDLLLQHTFCSVDEYMSYELVEYDVSMKR